jgi:hypothetical protein
MSGWTTGFMMAIGLAVAPVTAASQPNNAEPIKPKISQVASVHDDQILATEQGEAIIVLHVVNYATLSDDVLDEARLRVTNIYAGIGVRTVWVDSEQAVEKRLDGGLHLTVMLLPREMVGVSDDAFGRAHPGIGRAYIFCNRVASMPGPKFFAISLGAVIAHEVGHLVLPEKSHSRSGIMRREIDVQHAINPQSFDKSQADSIRKTLMTPTVGATGR